MPRAEGSRFIIVANEELLTRAIPVLHQHISDIYQAVEFNVYPLKGDRLAIESADPNFYMNWRK